MADNNEDGKIQLLHEKINCIEVKKQDTFIHDYCRCLEVGFSSEQILAILTLIENLTR